MFTFENLEEIFKTRRKFAKKKTVATLFSEIPSEKVSACIKIPQKLDCQYR